MRRALLRSRPRLLISASLAAALAMSLSGLAALAGPASASTPVVVTLGFDDGTVDQFDQGFPA